jgi:hypothetical protein
MTSVPSEDLDAMGQYLLRMPLLVQVMIKVKEQISSLLSREASPEVSEITKVVLRGFLWCCQTEQVGI